MALKSELRVGQEITFGRPNGEQTRGIIVKLNPTKAKVKTTENRGINGRSSAGVEWNVPYSLITLAGQAPTPRRSFPIAPPLITLPGQFSVGERVEFDARGTTIVGIISRVNGKSVAVEPLDGSRGWRVSPNLLRRSSDTTPIAPAPAVNTVAQANAEAVAKRTFERYASMFGLKPEWFGTTFTSKGTGYRVAGINTRAPKFPVNVVRVRDNTPFKFTASAVQFAKGK